MAKSHISSIDLILLGLIRNKPMSAYDLSKMQGVYELVKISIPAIYKNMRRLENKGYLEFSTEKPGKMPEKKVYSITKKGEQRFQELLELCASNTINFYFDFNVSLLFINSIDKIKGRKLIDLVKDNLESKHKLLKFQVEKYQNLTFSVVNLGMQHMKLSEVLLEWLTNFSEDFEKIE